MTSLEKAINLLETRMDLIETKLSEKVNEVATGGTLTVTK